VCQPFRLIDSRYPNRGTEGGKLFLDGPHEQRAQILHQLVAAAGVALRLSWLTSTSSFVRRCIGQIPGRLTEAIKDTTLISLGELIEAFEPGDR
jgi:hypothetical protein